MAPTMADERMKAANKLGRCHCGDRPTTAMVRQAVSRWRRVLMVLGVWSMQTVYARPGFAAAGQAGDLYLMLHPYGAVVAAEIGLPANASASPTFT